MTFATYLIKFAHMKSHNLHQYYEDFQSLINQRRFSKAIELLEIMAQLVKSPWTVTADIQSLKQQLGYIVDYALRAADDPSRASQLNDLVNKAKIIATTILRQVSMEDSPKQYFSILRYEALQPKSTIAGLIEQYGNSFSRYSLAALVNQSQVKDTDGSSLKTNLETLATRIFNVVWTKFPIEPQDMQALKQAIVSDSLPHYFKDLIIGALLLGYLDYPDQQRLALLAHSYLVAPTVQSVKALSSLSLALLSTPDIQLTDATRQLIDSIAEYPQAAADLSHIAMALARTRDTERLSRTLNDEIIPQFMKMAPKPDSGNILNVEEIEENPEWMDMMDKSGLSEKLRDLTEETANGSDVMMGSFSHLKSFPFFHDVANWFLPFYTSHSQVSPIIGDESSTISQLLESAEMMCNSDKYSMALSFDKIQAEGRKMMLEQFDEQLSSMAEDFAYELNSDRVKRNQIITCYIQDLYRFFYLYRRSGDFKNPLLKDLNLTKIKVFGSLTSNQSTIRNLAEYYFGHKYYSEAFPYFEALADSAQATPLDLQRAGFSLQRLGFWEQALEYYEKSVILLPDNLWTLHRMAQCNKALRNYDEALELYLKVLSQRDNNISLILETANCMMQLGQYKEAIKLYYKAQYLAPESHKADRDLGWALFLTQQYDKALPLFDAILALRPTADDYRFMGHLFMAMRQYEKALIYYGKSKDAIGQGNDDIFYHSLLSDKDYLASANVDPDIIDIVFDKATS